VKVLGIVQEQHADRARLFMQWHEMDWPLMVDSLDLLGVWLVPITVAIDEYGIVRAIGPSRTDPDALRENFVNVDFPRPKPMLSIQPRPPDDHAAPAPDASAKSWRDHGDALLLWGGLDKLGAGLEAYRRALDLAPDDAITRFRVGVAYRSRHDSPLRGPDDFRYAVEQWSAALAMEPNQYIWRRRLQQYGPRLDKPYPFYDWVAEARREIRARGDTPLTLLVEPAGAELAAPATAIGVPENSQPEPDPEELVWRDRDRFVRINSAPVPSRARAGDAFRVHLLLAPDIARHIHWNNEAGSGELWLEPAPGWATPDQRLTLPSALAAVSDEDRMIDFELRSPTNAGGVVPLNGYALYYICEGADGICMYRRQDFRVLLNIDADATPLGGP